MKRWFLILILMLLGSVTSLAQDIAPIDSHTTSDPPPPPDEIVNVIPPNEGVRMTNRIAFLVDSSGSMDNSSRMSMALAFASSVLGQEGDDMLIALFSFKDNHSRWPGFPHDGNGVPPPKGWTEFPGVQQLKSAEDWLNRQAATGGTNPCSAIREALSEDINNLTVIVITDGDFEADTFKEAIISGQKTRELRGKTRAIIILVGIGEEAAKRQHMLDVAKAEGGGFYVVKRPDLPDDIDDWGK